MSELLGQRLRQALQFLARQSTRRARTEASLTNTLQTRKQAIADRSAHVEQQLKDRRTTTEAEAARLYKKTNDEVESRFASAYQEASETWAAAQDAKDEELADAKEQHEADYQEARWTIDSILEADKKVARDELGEQQRAIGKLTQEIDGVHRDIKRQLIRLQIGELFRDVEDPRVDAKPNPDAMSEYRACLDNHYELLHYLKRMFLPRLLKRPRLLIVFVILWVISLVPMNWMTGENSWWYWLGATALATITIGITVRILLVMQMRAQVRRLSRHIKENLAEANLLKNQCVEQATETYQQALTSARKKYDDAYIQARTDYKEALKQSKTKHQTDLETLRAKYEPLLQKLRTDHDRDIQTAEQNLKQTMSKSAALFEAGMKKMTEQKSQLLSEAQKKFQSGWQALTKEWQQTTEYFGRVAYTILTKCDDVFPAWNKYQLTNEAIPQQVPMGMPFGQIDMNMEYIPNGIPVDRELRAMMPPPLTLPALLDFPHRGSLVIKAQGDGREHAVQLLQALMLRFLLSMPPGKVRFTIMDPVGLGENFAAFAHLADFDDKLVTSRIWTESGHIEKRLADLTEHIENIIQKYLRNQFDSLEEYNAQAGEVAEPYRLLVIAHFPVNFTEEAARRVQSIAQSGRRCGLHTLILVDTRLPLPDHFDLADLEKESAVLIWDRDHFVWQDDEFGRLPLRVEMPPDAETYTTLLHLAGERAQFASRVEVPFRHIAPPAAEWWRHDTQDGVRVALGKAGATRKQLLQLGSGTSQHVLIAGKTGSGKSNLLHALILQLALSYSPDQMELYLVDFKKGVEFKTYATNNLPHARVVAIESEREFGLSVLKRLDNELKTRGEKFRMLGVHDLRTFRETQTEPLPRVLLIVDEFQEFFVEDDRVAQEAALLLDRLVRQGRAFGIHILLGSQTLGGAYSLARSTIDQMAVRIALQCSEADGHLILDKDNSAARLLSRPGEAIYNDANGLLDGNNLFQVVWMPDTERDELLREMPKLVEDHKPAKKDLIIFEGNAPALLEKNQRLESLLRADTWPSASKEYTAWLGEAIAIKDPTAAVFRRQSGCNLLMIGQHPEAALSIMNAAVMSLAANCPPNEAATPADWADFYLLCDLQAEGNAAQLFTQLGDIVPHKTRIVGWEESTDVICTVAEEVQQRISERQATAPPIFLFIYALHQFRNLRRQEDDFSFSRRSDDKPAHPSEHLANILRDGPGVGVFTILWTDTLNNVQRYLDRQLLREFELRVLFQMNASDSSNLIDSPIASKLGLHRAFLYAEDQGRLEKFRPYGQVSDEWSAWVGRQFQRAARIST